MKKIIRDVFPIYIKGRYPISCLILSVSKILNISIDSIALLNEESDGQVLVYYEIWKYEFGYWVDFYIPTNLLKLDNFETELRFIELLCKETGKEIVLSSESLLTSEWLLVNPDGSKYLIYEVKPLADEDSFVLDYASKTPYK